MYYHYCQILIYLLSHNLIFKTINAELGKVNISLTYRAYKQPLASSKVEMLNSNTGKKIPSKSAGDRPVGYFNSCRLSARNKPLMSLFSLNYDRVNIFYDTYVMSFQNEMENEKLSTPTLSLFLFHDSSREAVVK